MSSQGDQRRTPRAPVSIRIDYGTVDDFFWDFARNINEEGVFVESNNPLAVGTTVNVKFYLPNLTEPIETTGEVLWVKTDADQRSGSDADMEEDGTAGKPGMGIQFKGLDEESKAAINGLVQELRKK
ncbi:MAG: TIGR02266 family protein [bacterium]|nr:TIGR02266 family protein [bacterium]